MENVWRPQDLHGLDHGAGEKGKAFCVIVVVAQRSTVERIPVEVRRVVNEIELHSSALSAADHGTEAVAVIERHGDAGDYFARIVEFGLLVTWEENRDLVTQRGKCRRQ